MSKPFGEPAEPDPSEQERLLVELTAELRRSTAEAREVLERALRNADETTRELQRRVADSKPTEDSTCAD